VDVIWKLEVRLQLGGEAVTVGTLAERERRIFFELCAGFLDSGLQLSPLDLPLRAGVHEGPPSRSPGLAGVFRRLAPRRPGSAADGPAFRGRSRAGVRSAFLCNVHKIAIRRPPPKPPSGVGRSM